jgi:hypothetical protein
LPPDLREDWPNYFVAAEQMNPANRGKHFADRSRRDA